MRRIRVSGGLRPGPRRGGLRAMPPRSSISRRGGRRIPVRLVLAGVIVLVGLVGYFGRSAVNPVTGQAQHISLSIPDEIAIGLAAVPTMMHQYGGLAPDPVAQDRVDRIGTRLVNAVGQPTPWAFEFTLLGDPSTINAFALPGGKVFITRALYDRLETDAQLAGVLGHEVGHVLERHSAQQMAKGQLTQVLVGATGIATGDAQATRSAAALASLVNMSFGRDDELESDRWGVELMNGAGYDPRAMLAVLEILRDAGGGNTPEFFSTHPDSQNRVGRIEQAIAAIYPDGVPAGLLP